MFVRNGFLKQRIAARNRVPIVPAPAQLDLDRFIPTISPHLGRPIHLKPMLDVFGRIDAGEQVFAAFSVPPGHGKTELCRHGLARLLCRHQEERFAYTTYSTDFAREHSRAIRNMVLECGIRLDPSANRQEGWHTEFGGGLYPVGVSGPLTGRRVTKLAIVDDPFKDRQTANSATERNNVWGWFNSVLMTRLLGGASVIVIHTRWHVDDLIGRLENMDRWEVYNLPIYSWEDGERVPLMPTLPAPEGEEPGPGFDLDFIDFQEQQIGPVEWASLYMGQPRPEGGALFNMASRYDVAPSEGRISIGVDLAYTRKTHADFSTAVVLQQSGSKVYVLEVLRVQELAEDFVARLQRLSARYPGARMRFDGSASECGQANVIRKLGLPALLPVKATEEKRVRAQLASVAWNRGDILVPNKGSWVRDFIVEVETFTGVGDRYDDQVDAFASAYNALIENSGVPVEVRGRPLRSVSARDAL